MSPRLLACPIPCAMGVVLLLALAVCSCERRFPEFPLTVSPDPSGTTNAFFSSDDDGSLGLWIYRRSGTCPELRAQEQRVLALGSPKLVRHDTQVDELDYCFVLSRWVKTERADTCVPCRLGLFQSMRSTAPYEGFLGRGQAAPVDYVIGLFDRYDVVVICERLHPEGSQWDFIYEVVSDPRFIDRAGHVFTEYGQVEMQGYLDSFMITDGLAASEIHQRVVHLMRHWPVWPVWNNTNFYTYLTRLYELNQSLPSARRVHHYLTDVSVDWESLTREGYWAYRRSLANRDEQMARRVVTEMERLAASASTKPKCLVVMNYRHAFDLTGRNPGAERFNTFEFLKDAFRERAANVLLNTRILLVAPIAGGVWDAAFEQTGNRPAGFDLEGSPFGQDPFDLFPFRPEVMRRLKYRDVFTGLLFTHRQEEQYTQHGIPGYFAGFEDEALRRAMFIGEGYRGIVETLIDQEKRRDVALKEPVLDHESQVAWFLLGLMSVGLLLGVGLFTLSWRAQDRQHGMAPEKLS